MKTLNELYNNSCIPGYKSYKKISDKITLIDNFFADFDSARNFFISREKWQCTPYRGISKPGYESIFPLWIGKSLMERYILDNKIVDDQHSYKTECNFFHFDSDFIWSVPNSNYFPHIDRVMYHNILAYICLINVNLVEVSTKFYAFRDNEYCSSKLHGQWVNYENKIHKEFIEYNGKKPMMKDDVKTFLESKKELDIELVRTVQYSPNQAIIYPANLFHSANVTEEFTKENPRSLVRIIFDAQVNNDQKLINYS